MKITKEPWKGVEIPQTEVDQWVRDQAATPVSELANYPASRSYVTVTRSGNTVVVRDTFVYSDGRESTRIYECKVVCSYLVEKE